MGMKSRFIAALYKSTKYRVKFYLYYISMIFQKKLPIHVQLVMILRQISTRTVKFSYNFKYFVNFEKKYHIPNFALYRSLLHGNMSE